MRRRPIRTLIVHLSVPCLLGACARATLAFDLGTAGRAPAPAESGITPTGAGLLIAAAALVVYFIVLVGSISST